MNRVRRGTMPTLAAALCGALALAGCGRGGEPTNNLAALDRQLVANDADPAVTSAINDQILVDRSLSSQSNRNAVRSPSGPAQAQYPPGAGRAGPPPCAGALASDPAWARRLPPEFPIYPGARVTEAAGTDAAPCRLRAVGLATADPWDKVLGWYQAQAVRAGYSAERQTRDGAQILAGTKGGLAYYLIASPGEGGTEVSLIVGG
jgi:hypothetical protein